MSPRSVIEGLWKDVVWAFRGLRREPVFAFASVATLGFAIGLNVSVFTVVNAFFLRPWPVPNASQLFEVAVEPNALGREVDLRTYEQLAAQTRQFSGLAASGSGCGATLDSQLMRCQLVSENYFNVLGIRMARGRTFSNSPNQQGTPEPVAILSHFAWRRRFNSDLGILDRVVRINGLPFSIAGVTEAFNGTGTEAVDLWLPLGAARLLRQDHADMVGLRLAGRLAPGAKPGVGVAELTALLERAQTASTSTKRTVRLSQTRLLSPTPASNRALGATFIGTVMVLIISCTNLANLMLGRTLRRAGEMATRAALGASPTRLVRQLMTESLLLTSVACVVGVMISQALPWIIFVYSGVNRGGGRDFVVGFQPDMHVTLFACATAALACVILGAAPAFLGSRTRLVVQQDQPLTLPGRRTRLRNVLLSTQIALSTTLLIASGLLVSSAVNARTRNLGFKVDGVSLVQFRTGALDVTTATAFRKDLFTAISSFDRKEHFAFTSAPPFFGSAGISVARTGNPGEQIGAARSQVTDAYFDVLELPIVAGRSWLSSDPRSGLVLVNQTLARRLWQDRSAVGEILIAGGSQQQVIGVVKDADLSAASQSDVVGPMLFERLNRDTTSANPIDIVFRGTPDEATSEFKQAALQLDHRVSLEVTPLATLRTNRLAGPEFGAQLTTWLAGIALLVSLLGVWSVFTYVGTHRQREIAIRLALGATSRHVLSTVYGSTGRAIVFGLLIGVALPAAASQIIGSLVFGLGRMNVSIYSMVVVIMTGTAILASYSPISRATSRAISACLRDA